MCGSAAAFKTDHHCRQRGYMVAVQEAFLHLSFTTVAATVDARMTWDGAGSVRGWVP
jgi:hypothetical protein